MNIVIGLMPALFWGILPIWMQGRTGGNWTEQLLGTSVGGVISAIILQLIFHYDYSLTDFLLYFVSGVCWSVGQGGQYWGYGALGVNNAVPFSTALQIIGNSLIGGWVFGEWVGWHDSVLGVIALLIILAGVMISNGVIHVSRKDLGAYAMLVITCVGYWGYSGFPHYAVAKGLNGFLPQTLGMMAGALTIYVVGRKRIPGQDPWGLRNITSGFIFAVAAGTYLMSLSLNGLVNGFVLTQLNVVVATLLGGVVMKEANVKQLVPKTIGLAVLIGGAVMMVHI